MEDDFLKWSEEVRDGGCSPHNILPTANQPMGEWVKAVWGSLSATVHI